MAISLSWVDGEDTPQPPQSSSRSTGAPRWPVALPHAVESAIWRGDALGTPFTTTIGTGFEALDAELPGNGWPCQSLTEVLQVQPSVLEWRLLAPAMRTLAAVISNWTGRCVLYCRTMARAATCSPCPRRVPL